MAVAKLPVSALQEYCSQNKIFLPIYEIITDEEFGFVCKVEVNNMEEMGHGRSKRDAKHSAANNMLKRLKTDCRVDIESDTTVEAEDIIEPEPMPPTDTVMLLRDYCIQHESPLPKFTQVNQYGAPNAPRFTILCQVASIQRYGTAGNKIEAKQKAAWQMLQVIKSISTPIENEVEIVPIDSKIVEEERYKLFKTYRSLVDSGEKSDHFGVRINERHNTYTRFYDHLKKEAFNILDTPYESSKIKAYDLLDALKIRPKVKKISSKTTREMLFIELDVPSMDTCFSGYEDDIYSDIIDFFRNMLV